MVEDKKGQSDAYHSQDGNSKEDHENFTVTPWEVRGKVDYDKLVKDFGTQKIDTALINRLNQHFGETNYMLRRGIFYSHRDLNWILDQFERGERFHLYTGRGPSGHTHLGHILPWLFTRYLQEKFGVNLYFQLTDDEKFLFNPDLTLEDTRKLAYENALDFVALGFEPKNTKIFLDTEYIHTLYGIAIKVAKRITFSTTKASFGFTNSTNIGSIFYTSIQAAPCYIETEIKKKNVPCLVPCAIDQDPHFRLTRDVAPLLGYYKPALVHCKLLPSLAGGDKMSASVPDTSIFTTDAPKSARKKVMNAFTGGCATVSEQREKGANPDVCSIYAYYNYIFEPDDAKLDAIRADCIGGKVMCGECKSRLAERVVKWLEEHQTRREKARERLEEYMLRD